MLQIRCLDALMLSGQTVNPDNLIAIRVVGLVGIVLPICLAVVGVANVVVRKPDVAGAMTSKEVAILCECRGDDPIWTLLAVDEKKNLGERHLCSFISNGNILLCRKPYTFLT
jgi:hypothetical protein